MVDFLRQFWISVSNLLWGQKGKKNEFSVQEYYLPSEQTQWGVKPVMNRWFVLSEPEPDLLSSLSGSSHAPQVATPHLSLIIYNAEIYIWASCLDSFYSPWSEADTSQAWFTRSI